MLSALMDRIGIDRIGSGFMPGRPAQRGERAADWLDSLSDPAPSETASGDRFGPATRMRLSSEALARLRAAPQAQTTDTSATDADDPLAAWLDRPAHPTAGQLSRLHSIVARYLDDGDADAPTRMMAELAQAGLGPAQFAAA